MSETGFLDRLVRFCLEKKLLVFLLLALAAEWGALVAPFDWPALGPLRDPVPVDAIPDIGENQQIVFTEWSGRSPQDVEDQITYPLTASLMGIPGVRTVRSFSMFGFSSIYVIFHDDVDFYWSRSRILEKLNSLPPGSLPPDARPALGPDATAMGQVFWYTLEGRDPSGRATGGWDLHELRTIQDWYVRFALMAADGVSEVASVGGFVREYQVDLDPDRMRAFDVTLEDVLAAVRGANRDVGAQTIEVNRVEYLIRGLGFIREPADLETAVIRLDGTVPVFLSNVARVALGPATRQGALDKGGAEAVGGVVAVRFGENPLEVIRRVREKIAEISPGLPRKTLPDGTESQVAVVPFYDRTRLIHETLDTLETALFHEMLVTLIVLIAMARFLRTALMVAAVLPLAVLVCFIAMKLTGVDANVVALAGIAIAIGTMVDMGIILTDAIARQLDEAGPSADRGQVIRRATREVGGAVVTAVATTVVGFLPVFTLVAAEGKLFRPLAFTKTFALIAALLIALILLPPLAHAALGRRKSRGVPPWACHEGLIYLGGLIAAVANWRLGLPPALVGGWLLIRPRLPARVAAGMDAAVKALLALGAALALAALWRPLGYGPGLAENFLFVVLAVGGLLLFFLLFQRYYERLLTWCLDHKTAFLVLPGALVLLGFTVWLGFGAVFGWLPRAVRESPPMAEAARRFPGLGEEFMPPLEEGSYLLMPTTMPHASIGEVLDILRRQDAAIQAIPEVERAVGKLGRADSALDPAPVSMIETLVTYRAEFLGGEDGPPPRFRHDPAAVDFFRSPDGSPAPAPDGRPYRVRGRFERDEAGALIPDPDGRPFRVWRPGLDPSLNPGRDGWRGIRRPDDIWDRITARADVPGTTTPARLQPISARMVMLQSGIRANMGVRVSGPDLSAIQAASLEIEALVREVREVAPGTVIADRILGKPYLEIEVDRLAIAQYGIPLQRVLDVIEFAIGGRRVTTTVEGRERYPVRVRYTRELRDDIESLGEILAPGPGDVQIPLAQIADIRYVRGPGAIKGEDTFLVGYVLFDGRPGLAQGDVVDAVDRHLKSQIDSGRLALPAGVSYSFAGTYENQIRAEKRLQIILPVALIIIFLILYLQFGRVSTSLLVFTGIAVAWAGGFLMMWLYAQPWFLDVRFFGADLRELFQVGPVNLSVAIWVGFLALFGIASDDGVVMATYLERSFSDRRPETIPQIRAATVAASLKRVRPCLMTTATTLLALLPVLTSTGRGSDIMIPMAIPSFGGMAVEVVTMLVVPVLFCALRERELERERTTARETASAPSPSASDGSFRGDSSPATSHSVKGDSV
jgi:Cu(I)/Ag(I) efflux system membrane protein CusA/SilA